MVVLIEARGPKYGSRGQTQNFLDLEVSAAPHLHHAEPASSAQCDLDPGLAGTPPPPDLVCDWATREVLRRALVLCVKIPCYIIFIYLLRPTL